MVISFLGTRGFTLSHQKCDAKRPCKTCVHGDRSDGCVYESRWRPHPIGVSVFSISHDSKSGTISARTSPSQTSVDWFSEPPTSPSPELPLLTWSDYSESASPISPSVAPRERPSKPTTRLLWEPSPRIHNEVALVPPSNVSVVQKIHVERVPRRNGSSFTVLPSIHFQTIPRPLRVPLSFVPPEYVQLSSVAEDDLAMSLCVFLRLLNLTGSWKLNRSIVAA